MAIVFGLVLVLWVVLKVTPRRETMTTPGHPASGSERKLLEPEQYGRFLAIEAQENLLDQTVWAKELLAQRYEDVIVKLWDDLKDQEERFKVLADFTFAELEMAAPGDEEQLEHGIKRTRFDGPAQKLTPEAWRKLLGQWQADGYAIEQTEWRQIQFTFDDISRQARSTFELTVHAINRVRRERTVLRGHLRVDWPQITDETAPLQPQTIRATDFERLRREGEPAFQEAMAAEIVPEGKSVFIDPLILYDLDGDGLSEIVLAAKNLVFRNRGNGKFEGENLCQHHPGVIYAAVIADFTKDGFADFLCADAAGLLLFEGDSRGQFLQAGIKVWRAPLPLRHPQVIAPGDLDGDGDLDVWLGQYKLPFFAGQMPTPYYDANDGFPSFLLVNTGGGAFQDVTEKAGLAPKRFRRVYSSSLVDLDGDGDQDLLVISDFAGVDLYYNDGHGTFTDVTRQVLDETHAFGMSHTLGDFDADGRLDFLMIGMNLSAAQRLDGLKLGRAEFPDYHLMRPKMTYGNRCYLARGQSFQQPPWNDQIARSGWSWGAAVFDFDNDADLDIYLVNGHESNKSVKDYDPQFWCHDIYVGTSQNDPAADVYFRAMSSKLRGQGRSYGGYEKNRLYIHQTGQSYFEAGHLMSVAMEQDCRNLVSDDLDGDGKRDLLVTTFEIWPNRKQTLHLFRNNCPDAGNWIGFRLREEGAGLSPLGARITLSSAGQTQMRLIVAGESFRSQHANTVHFGLRSATNVDAVEIRWANGKTRWLSQPAVNRYHDVAFPRE